ncbi:MAG: cell surface protein SprA [Candidatus Eisenbacteria bacterium]|uniref:Cell surface protein SprA n=1 Tax=Eiseniibacteriota bacterium TaxID=2212470 RepID=A0A956RPJ7_UNCEI|nr:cell surface protein SprA [Candidatus Eisenbacteria bacterium]
MSRKSWRFPAIPLEVLREEGSDSLKAASRRGELLWYSPRTALQEWDLQPTLETREGDDNRQMMELYLATNGDTEEEHRRSWVGITQPISIRGADLSQAQFLDIWINDGVPYEERHRREGTLYIDLGSVSEDAMWHQNDLFADPSTWTVVPPNGRFDTEDVSGDGVLDQSDTNDEDTGLDRLSDAQGDTSFDDYRFDLNSDAETYQPIQFRYVNGTEGNQNLDTEDLNDDLVPQRSNSYFELAIDLADSTLWETDVRRDFVVRDPGEPLTEVPADTSGWRRIRIPLADEKLVKIFKDVGVSDPVWERIFHARMWLTGFSGERQRIQFGGIEIIGNRWFERPLSDLRDVELSPTEVAPGEEFFVGVLNNKDDAAVYSPPFTPRDLPQENVQEREQSITLELRNFQPGHRAAIYRIFPREQNYSSLYETLEFYLNRRFVAGDASLVMSVRLSKDAASDTTNYYEYTRPLPDGWDEVKIDLAELSRLQLASPDSLTGKITQQLDDGAVISRRGTPSLTSVRRVTFTVTNVGRTPLSEGGVWIDEFRLSGVKKNTGTAKRLQVTAKLSDFMDFTGNFEKKGADFVSIGQDQGSGTTATTMNLSSRIALQKFIERTGVLLPLSWSYNKSRLIPKFKTNSDLVVDTPTDRDINEREDQQVSLNYSKRRSDNAWMRYLVDPFSASYTRGHTVTLAPTQRDTTVTNAGSVNWQLGLDNVGVMRLPERGLPGFLGKPELQLLPTQLSASFSKRSTERQLYQRTDLSKPFVREETYSPTSTQLAMGMAASPIRAIRYKIDSSRDLNLRQNQETLFGLGLGRERTRRQDLNANWDLPVLRLLLAPRVTWQGGSDMTFLEQGGTVNEGEPDRYNGYRNDSSTTLGGRIGVEQFGDFIETLKPGAGKDSVAVRSKSRGGGGGSAIRLHNVNLQYTISTNTTYSRRRGEPSLAFQLGLSRDLGGQTRALSNATRSTTDTKRFGWDTTVDLPINMSIKPRFGHDVSETNGNGVTNIRRSTTWPEFDLTWGNLHKRLRLDQLLHLKSFSANTRYSRESSETGPNKKDLISRTTTTAINPLLSVRATLDNGISATLNTSHRETVTEQLRQQSVTRSSESRANLDLKKSLTLRKRVKVPGSDSYKVINTRMDVNAGVNWETNSTETRSPGAPPSDLGSVKFALSLGSSYQFTDRITGSANLQGGQDTNTKQRSLTSRFITVSVSASFSF